MTTNFRFLSVKTRQFLESVVRKAMGKNDGSHDFGHVDRVRKLAMHIGKRQKQERLDIIEASALLHDLFDWKYKDVTEEKTVDLRSVLDDTKCEEKDAASIVKIVQHLGFNHRIAGTVDLSSMPPEFGVVSDADMLEAIGAIGTARAFLFGGAKGSRIIDPTVPPLPKSFTVEEYKKTKGAPVINHFSDKLLKLESMMLTSTGREMAKSRHQFMKQFIEQFKLEMWDVDCEVPF